jgi:hypothetical protein
LFSIPIRRERSLISTIMSPEADRHNPSKGGFGDDI